MFTERVGSSHLIEAIRILFAAYFIVLAVLAVMGRHRWFLTYPIQVVYSLVRVVVLLLTLGRVRMSPVFEAAARQPRETIKKASWRARLRRGEEIDTDGIAGGWSSSEEALPASTEPDSSPPDEPEAFETPEELPLEAKEASPADEENPFGSLAQEHALPPPAFDETTATPTIAPTNTPEPKPASDPFAGLGNEGHDAPPPSFY